jgi:cysteine desulfurase family protein
MTFLDSAATTLIKPYEVYRAADRAMRTMASPGRGAYRAAEAAAEEAYECRRLASELFGAESPEKVVICFNATHALNIAVKSLVGPGDTAVISGYEHNSVLRPLKAVGARIRTASSPLFDAAAALEAYDRLLRPGVKAAVVNHVSNVFGFILPVREIARMCRERDIPLIIDASQAAGTLETDMSSLGAAFMAMPGHKGLYGPQGTGLLLCAGSAKPIIEGGSGSSSRLAEMPEWLPDRLEAGTHNMPGIAGLRAGMEFVKKTGSENILRHERELLKRTAEALRENGRLKLFLAEDPALQTGVLSFSVRDTDSERAAAFLAREGIAVRAGLHCAPLAHATAGTDADGTVRISFCAFSTRRDVDRLVRALKKME